MKLLTHHNQINLSKFCAVTSLDSSVESALFDCPTLCPSYNILCELYSKLLYTVTSVPPPLKVLIPTLTAQGMLAPQSCPLCSVFTVTVMTLKLFENITVRINVVDDFCVILPLNNIGKL
jgi:hypothetical protein